MPEDHAGTLFLLMEEVEAVAETSVIKFVHDVLRGWTVTVEPGGRRNCLKSKGPVRFRRGLAGSAMRQNQRMRPHGNPPLGVVVVCMVVTAMWRMFVIGPLSPKCAAESNRSPSSTIRH